MLELINGLSLSYPALAIYLALGILSFLALAVTFVKLLQFAKLGVGRHAKAEAVIETWLDGRAEDAYRQAGRRQTVTVRVLQATFTGLDERPEDPRFAEELARQSALLEMNAVTGRMRVLEGIVQTAPMLGLLGTVIGMIEAFGTLSQAQGAIDPTLFAGGIYVALTTTAIGLTVAIITYTLTAMLQGRIDREKQTIEALVSMAINGRVGGD